MNQTITQTEGKINTILNRLDGVKRSGKGYIGKCPAHPDRTPSLSITQGDDGKILLYCFAGCSIDDICRALEIELKQLFPDGELMSSEQKKEYQAYKKHRETERDFIELRRRAFIAMVEFRNLTLPLYDYYKLGTPAEILKAVQMLPKIEWYLEILTTKTSDAQLELLREGVISQWARLHNSQN